MPRTFTFAFPMQLNSGGGVLQDQTPDSQLRLLTHTEIGQRIDDREYGFPPYAYEQASLGDEIRRPITLVLTQIQIGTYIPDLLIRSLGVVREPVRRRLAMNLEYIDRNRLATPQQTQFGLGLEDA